MAVDPCVNCGAPLALADERCPQCGKAVDPSVRALAQVGRAKAFAEAGQIQEAKLALERLRSAPPGPLAEAWTALGRALEKTGAKGDEEALAAFQRAIQLEDGRELVHQLLISNLCRRGRSAEAVALYQARAAKDPEDALSQRLHRTAKLAADFANQAPPQRPKAAALSGKGLIGKALNWCLEPKPLQLSLAGLGLAMGLGQILVGQMMPPEAAAPAIEPDLAGALPMAAFNPLAVLGDPWMGAFSVGLHGLWLWALLMRRRG